jgi:hypothetical protein
MRPYDELDHIEKMCVLICPGCAVIDPEMEWVDFGIGSYEYWGAPGVDVQWAWVTRCCEADPEPFWPEPNPDHINENDIESETAA